jgi:uncharacterized heparinase superfamily protein
MYQSLLVEDLLVAAFAGSGPSPVRAPLIPAVARMVAALEALTHPDGRIALFNDAAFGTALAPPAIRGWAAAAGVPVPGRAGDLPSAGYFRLGNEGELTLFDAGPLGPDHLPAHAHCDALSFEWSLDGERIVTDTGVDRYEAGPERDFQRSTAAHSTLQVGTREQGEPFGSFRMGRRPDVQGRRTAAGTVEGRHDGFGEAGVHRREIRMEAPGRLSWTDSVAGWRETPVTVRTAFAAGCDAAVSGTTARIRTPSGRVVRLETPSDGALRIDDGTACERFGVSGPRPVLTWTGVGGRGREHPFRLTRP